MSESLWPNGLQHTRLLCPPLSPRVCSNSRPLSQWQRRKWQPTPIFLLGESHGQRSLAGHGPWGHRVGQDWSDWARKSVMLSNHLILCRPLLILPSIFPSIRVFPMSWLFTSHGQSIGLQYQSFQWIFRLDFILDWLVGSPSSPRDSLVFSSTTTKKHQFFIAQSSLWSSFYTSVWLLKTP